MSLLVADAVTKRFSGLTALDQVSLAVDPGEIVGLIGPNGAGKTTLFNCLYGVLTPDQGRVTFDGHDLSRLPVHRRARLGMGRTFQRIELFVGMTVRDHLLVAERARRGDGGLLKDLLNRAGPSEDERAGWRPPSSSSASARWPTGPSSPSASVAAAWSSWAGH